MPTLKIIGQLSTRPFASDDLQIMCLFIGLLRLMHLVCVAPLWIHLYMLRFRQGVNAVPWWCELELTATLKSESTQNDIVMDEGGLFGPGPDPHGWFGDLEGRIWFLAYLFTSVIQILADVSLLAAIWSAACVGTPTEPMGRERFLRPLLRIKLLVLYPVTVGTVVLGVLLVHINRLENYGCDTPFVPGQGFEATNYYTLLCTAIVSQAMESFVFPSIMLGKAFHMVRRHNPVRLENAGLSRETSIDVCMTGCFKVCGLLCCKPTDMANAGELKDAASAVLEFFRDTLYITWSDLYISIRMLAQVQRERRLERVKFALAESRKYVSTPDSQSSVCIATTLLTGDLNNVEEEEDDFQTANDEGGDERRPRMHRRPSVAVLLRNDNGTSVNYERVVRKLLVPGNSTEIGMIRKAIRYAKHSNAIYGDLLHLCKGYVKLGINVFQTAQGAQEVMGSILDTFLDHTIRLDSLGLDNTVLAYSNFVNGINKTPYSISIDQEHREVILAIRGTASLEDAVIDLQLIPLDLTEVGRKCGFRGEGEMCHKGVLTRCLWIYEDLKEQGVLRDLLLGDKPRLQLHNLIVTGHSLGAGCATILSCMLKQQFPYLKCFAFCPPGGLVSDGLADFCKPFVTSFVNGADIIPRMSLQNCEKLRDEALETLARVKVSKFQVYQSLRNPHSDQYVEQVNAHLLYSKDDTPRHTDYYEELEDFRERKRAKYEQQQITPLCLPGRIVQIIQTKKGCEKGKKEAVYTSQWAERTDFNEILLSTKIVDDHSMANVIPNLQAVLQHLANPSMAVLEEDDVLEDMFDLSASKKAPIVIRDRSFICCSRPHGNRSVLGAILAATACFLALLANSNCVFVGRSTEVIDLGGGDDDEYFPPTFNGIGVSTGLYNYERTVWDGEGDRQDPDSWQGVGICQSYPLWFVVDPYLKAARAFGALAVITGGMAMLILFVSTCIQVSFRPWICQTILLVLAVISEFLVFGLFFQSSVCTTFEYDQGDAHLEVISECEVSWGSNVAKACMAIWFTTIVLTIKYPKPRL